MSKNTKWYDLKEVKDGYRIFYSFSIRIQALFLLIFSLIMLYFEVFENNEKLNIFGFIIFLLIFTLSFVFTFLIDSFSLQLTKSQIIRKKGIFPFVISKKIRFDEINSISSDVVERKKSILDKVDSKNNLTFNENYPSGYYTGKIREYSIGIELKNGKIYRISFGKGEDNIFNKFLDELKKIS